MNLRNGLAVVASLLLLPGLCAAQSSSRSTGWEFGLDALYQFSKDVDFDGGSKLNLEDDVGLALTFGYRFNSRVELQFQMDWNNVDYKGVLQSAQIPSLSASVHGEMESFVPRMSVVYNFMDGPITPYVKGGIGWAFIDTNIPTGQVQVGCWWDPWYGQICTPYQPTKNVDSFTYNLGLGVRWDVGGYSTVRFSYEKAWFDLSHASAPGLDQLKIGYAYRY